VADDKIFIADTKNLQWGRVTAPHTDPSSTVIEGDKLVPQGFGLYAMTGRHKQGLCILGIYVVAIGTSVKVFLRANVPIKEFTMPVPINQVLYEILPDDPKMIERAVSSMAEDPKELPSEVIP
jgi:hypothetical protein